MSTPLISRRSHRAGPALDVIPDMALPLMRLHEICGPARHTLAMLVAAATTGPVFWIAPTWAADHPNPDGMLDIADPRRFTFLSPIRAEDALWSLEEVLRSGAVPLVIGDIPAPPGLTAVRRMHLAAETGAAEGSHKPLGLILTPEGAAPGVETRWHMAQAHTARASGWTLTRQRARTAPPKSWSLHSNGGKIVPAANTAPQSPPNPADA